MSCKDKHEDFPSYLLRILLCTIFRMTILSVLLFRKSVILFFKPGFVSCLEITLRLSHDSRHLFSSCTKLSASASKSTCLAQKYLDQAKYETIFQFGVNEAERDKLYVKQDSLKGFWLYVSDCIKKTF